MNPSLGEKKKVLSNWTILSWNTRKFTQESWELRGYKRADFREKLGSVRNSSQNTRNELPRGQIWYLWHWRFMQVQLKSLHNISEVFSMKTNHIFGYTRLVTPRKRKRIPIIFEVFELQSIRALPSRKIHWTNGLLQCCTVHKVSIFLNSVLFWKRGIIHRFPFFLSPFLLHSQQKWCLHGQYTEKPKNQVQAATIKLLCVLGTTICLNSSIP